MIHFKTYLREVWNTDDLEDVDMSHGYRSYSTLSSFPTPIDTHDLYDFRQEMMAAHVAAGGNWKDIDDPTSTSPHVQRYKEYQKEYERKHHESSIAHSDDETKRIKTIRHNYSYPTLGDIERIKSSAVNGMVPETKYKTSFPQRMHPVEHVLKNIHMFPHQHSGSITFTEYEGKPTDVMISEHGRHRKEEGAKTTVESATNAYKYIISSLRHFTSLPHQPWKKDMDIFNGRSVHGDGVTPHRMTDVPSGVHVFSGSTADPRKHLLYNKITKQMGHIFINTSGQPVINTRQDRISRRERVS